MLIQRLFVSIIFFVSCSVAVNALAGRCDPEMLANLPEKKRQMIEKRCTKQAKKEAYTISNKGKEAKEAMPVNAYKGDDRDELIKKVTTAWKKKYPKDNVLAVRITSENWKRDVNVRANSTSIYKNDKSVLVAKVVVKTDNKMATLFPAYINKNNADGSIKMGVATKKRSYVIKQMLLSNVEK